jgi:UPF0755 protein
MNRETIIVVIIAVIVAIWWQPLNLGKTEVTVPDNTNAREIAEFLAERRIVRNVEEFLFWLKVTGQERALKSGTYELYQFKNPIYLIGRLSAGGRSEIIVTLPEGLTIFETAQILAYHELVDESRFIELCHDESFIHTLGLAVSSLEGYFFPDTYSFSSLQNEESIITAVVKNFAKKIARFGLVGADSIHQVVVLASIVEKEAKYEDERPIIARVFLNRMRMSRPLESCATVFYILKKKEAGLDKQKLTDRDLEIESPYNTYLHLGLPPGPICSPGESSIRAAIWPADVDYLYFVAKGDGRHHFSRTFKEHVAAKDRYQ